MIEQIKKFIDKILSFNIGNLFQFKMNNKLAETMQDNKLVEANYNDNSQKIIQQNYVIAIMHDINIDDAIKSALAIGNENARLVGLDVEKSLSDNAISETEIKQKLSNPEVLYTIANANEIAYKASDVDKRKILSNLIYKKITTDVENEDSIILSIAITEMELLSINHIKALSFLYLIKSDYLKNFSLKNLLDFQNKILLKLLDFKNSNTKNIGKFLESTRTVTTAGVGWNITSYIPQILTDTQDKKGKTVNNDFAILSKMWTDLGFIGTHITPVGKYIAQTYLFNQFGILVEDMDEKNSTKDLSEDVSAS